MDLRVDAEVRQVRDAVRKALHRDLVELDHRPAATPEDLLDGINETRPHVVHFSGHGGGAAVLFDNGRIDTPQGRDVPFELLCRALRATDTPPKLLLLNACDTLDGAKVLLDVVPVVVGTASTVSDLAAAVFSARFYSAVANGQSVGSALQQASVAIDLAGLGEGRTPGAGRFGTGRRGARRARSRPASSGWKLTDLERDLEILDQCRVRQRLPCPPTAHRPHRSDPRRTRTGDGPLPGQHPSTSSGRLPARRGLARPEHDTAPCQHRWLAATGRPRSRSPGTVAGPRIGTGARVLPGCPP